MGCQCRPSGYDVYLVNRPEPVRVAADEHALEPASIDETMVVFRRGETVVSMFDLKGVLGFVKAAD